MKIYDEAARREVATPNGVDAFYLHCRLFKFTEEDRRYTTALADRWSGYLLIEDYKSYVGEPGPKREKYRQRKRAYVKGPDSERIRHAISIIDAFKEPVG